MKTPSDELFNLIKSLSGPEKVAFKMFSGQGEEQSNYLLLFDAIDKQEQYDEKKLLLVLAKKDVINRIKDLKYNLQKVLYRFLQYHHFESSIEIQLQGYLQITEILFQKRLFSSAIKILVKAEKMAVENHQYLYLLNILFWKRKIIVKQLDLVALDQDEHKYYLTELHTIDLYKNMIEYQQISVRLILILITQSENPNELTIAELNEMLKNPFLQNITMAKSIPAKFAYCRILGNVHFILGNWNKSRKYLQNAVGYFEPAGVESNERLMVLARLITVLSKLKRSDELLLIKDQAMELVKSLPNKSQTIHLNVSYLAVMNNYIEYQLSICNTYEALSASDEILKKVENYASTQSFLVYYSNRVEIFILTGDYRKALQSANRSLTKEKTGIRKDVIAHVKILTLIIHYELGNKNLLLNLCKSHSYYFSKEKDGHNVEKIFLIFFGKAIYKKSGKHNSTNAFIALKKKLESCKGDKMLSNFDFISWAESKIESRPLMDVLKEKILSP